MTRKTSRRRFLAAAAAVGAAASLNVAVLAQDEDDGEVILLGGYTPGWQGYRVPGDGEDEDGGNPTLQLVPETAYTVLWRNVDGEPHNFALLDEDGDNLQVLQPLEADADQFEELNETADEETVAPEDVTVDNETAANVTPADDEDLVESTEIISEEGAVQAVRFVANEEMAQYICEVHPNTMLGDVELVEDRDGGDEENDSA